ncbi:uroporphyrinogen-III synthase-like [Diadema antillarum]|uniref:uroporphyrinogen-III synthase-like n=1 Tax=Diadema antillarum TaxID=105358 RepID=UPI003A83AB8B
MLSRMNCVLLRSVPEGSTSDKYQEAFDAAGVGCVSLSPIAFEFTNLPALFSHISRPEDFSGLVFSSPRTVESVSLCLKHSSAQEAWNRELKEKWRQLPAFSVGTSTGSRVRSLGLEPVGEDSGNAENLVKIIISAVKPGSKPLLYPCGTMRRETIPKTLEKEGIDFTADVVYQTIANTGLADQLMRYIKEKGAPDCIVFFSPSGVQYSKEVLEIHKDELSNTKFLAIGSTTQTAMEEKGYLVAGVADKPNPQALLQAIQQCLQEGRGQ